MERWITLNNPALTSNQGYGTGEVAPGVTGDGVNDYIVANNLLSAHAAAVAAYRQSQTGIYFTFTHERCYLFELQTLNQL